MEEHPFGWLSLTPPIVAIVLAILTRRIVLSLIVGIFAGALVMSGGRPLVAIGYTWETHLWAALIDPDKLRMFSFTLLMGSMIGVITKSGGMLGLVKLVTPLASNRRRGLLATWMLGILVFFDDYANTMLLGSTLQPVFQKLKISREKLAYVVDSTAAPVAALAPLSTWVAIEIDSIATGLEALPNSDMGAFGLFMASIPYRFYVWMALLLVPITALLSRDFGLMVRAENKTLAEGNGSDSKIEQVDQPKASSWVNAMAPILATLLVVVYVVHQTGAKSVCKNATRQIIGLIESQQEQPPPSLFNNLQEMADAGDVAGTRLAIESIRSEIANPEETLGGFSPKLSIQDIFGAADSIVALQYGALIGLAVAILLSWTQRIVPLDELIQGALGGAKVVLPAVAILWCAAAMSRMTTDKSVDGAKNPDAYEFKDHRLYTAKYLTTVLAGPSEDSRDANSATNGGLVSIEFLPSVVFLLAGAVAFCTGTSWGTMGILLPMVVQTAYALLTAEGMPATAENPILVSSIGGVLAGAVFGDHCSPISDTTVLSSQWSGCDHLSHVWTQLPYAALAATVSVLLGTLPLGFGVSVWFLLPAQVLAMVLVVRFFGQKVGLVTA